MTIRDWLIVAGIVILLGVVADLVRRYLQRGRLRLAIDEQYKDMPEVDLSAELPNGGARLVSDSPGWEGSSDSAALAKRQPEPTPATAEEQELEWKIDPLLTGVSPQDGEVDLLLEQEFKGVGEGADRWLSQAGQPSDETYNDLDDGILSSARVVQTPAEESQPIDEPQRKEQLHSFEEPQLIDESLAEQSVSAAQQLEAQPIEPETLVEVAVETEVEIETAPIVEPEPGIESAAVESDEPLSNPLAEPADNALEAEAVKPDLAVVAGEPEIDLERPVHELLQEQRAVQAELKADELESLGPAEPLVEPEPKPAPKPKKPAATRTRNKTKAKREPRPEEQTSFFDLHPDLAPEVALPETDVKPKRRRRKRAEPARSAATSQQEQAPLEEEVLILNVKAKDQPFPGALLFKLLNACGMTHGEMDIFHRHEEDDGRGALQFSMANAVAPGTFNPAEADSFSTPAVTFFLRLVDPTDRMNALECMLATAQCLADNLNGELKDENRSSIRSQTIEHYRQKVREFERKLLTRSS